MQIQIARVFYVFDLTPTWAMFFSCGVGGTWLENAAELKSNSSRWMPWNYKFLSQWNQHVQVALAN